MYTGRRSQEAQLRRDMKRAAKELVWKYCYNDYLISEAISRTDPSDVTSHLEGLFGYCDMSAVPCTFKGVVISDAYGRGVFQK